MPIKMIVTDLDGTLLRTNKSISQYTASVFLRCHDNGTILVYATARPIRAVAMLDLGIRNDAAIYHNGAVIAIEVETIWTILLCFALVIGTWDLV